MKDIGKQFFVKTICCLTAVTIFLSFIPIPTETLLHNDILGSTVIGLTYLATNLLQSVGRASGAVVLSLLRQGLLLIPLLYLMNALCGVQGIAAAHLIADVGAAAISAGILLHWLRALVEKTAEV